MKNGNWTVKDLKEAYDRIDHCKVGYCCYQDADISKYDLIELGYNRGIYGWNWTAYIDPKTSTMYVSCYRNVPGYIKEK